jgi:hypothetical protein
LNAIKIHWRPDCSGCYSGPVDISGEDLQFVPSCRQCSAEAVDGKNWSYVSHGWQIARNHVKNSHAPSRYEQNAIYGWNRPEERRIRRAATRKQGPTGSYATVKQVPSATARDFAGRTRMSSARHAARTPPECPGGVGRRAAPKAHLTLTEMRLGPAQSGGFRERFELAPETALSYAR